MHACVLIREMRSTVVDDNCESCSARRGTTRFASGVPDPVTSCRSLMQWAYVQDVSQDMKYYAHVAARAPGIYSFNMMSIFDVSVKAEDYALPDQHLDAEGSANRYIGVHLPLRCVAERTNTPKPIAGCAKYLFPGVGAINGENKLAFELWRSTQARACERARKDAPK